MRAALAAPSLALLAVAWVMPGLSLALRFSLGALALASGGLAAWWLTRLVLRPLGSLANVLDAVRQGELRMRGRVHPRSPLAPAFRELNALAETLYGQRLAGEESALLLRAVLDGLDIAVVAVDPDGRVCLANPAAEQLWGQAPGELVGRAATTLFGGDAAGAELAPHRAVAGTWELRRLPFRREGRPHELIVVSNVAEALRAEERALFQRLVRVLTHEVHNSLTPITTLAQAHRRVLERGPLDESLRPEMAEGLGVIARRADGLRSFLARYAELARLPPPEPVPFPVPRWIERVVRLEERVPVRLEGGGSPILVGDQDQLEQALLNLLRNAADAALEGGGHVTLRWRVRGDELIVTVEDDGPGLAGASSLFVPLFTTKPGGSGIGLVLARAIAEAHGGSVALEDRAPAAQGCRATLVLPLAPRARPAHRGFLRAASG